MMRFVLYGLYSLLSLLAAGLVFWHGVSPLPPAKPESKLAAPTRADDRPARSPAGNDEIVVHQQSAATGFDIAVVDPHGTSVFAGKAAPHSWVTVLADGVPVGSVESNVNGEWSLATDKRLSAAPRLAIEVGTRPSALSAAPPEPEAKVAAHAPSAPTPELRSAAADVGRNVVSRLEALVAAASADKQKVDGTARPPAQGEVKAEPGITEPVPILFQFREAEFTDEGRKAAQLLLEYLRLTHVGAVRLTGHADERGTDALNLDLSDRRLQTVASVLRRGGYDGRLELKPMGKSQPFLGVDRSKYDQEARWQLDRRVELVTQQD